LGAAKVTPRCGAAARAQRWQIAIGQRAQRIEAAARRARMVVGWHRSLKPDREQVGVTGLGLKIGFLIPYSATPTLSRLTRMFER
jgi:hypothetical protein